MDWGYLISLNPDDLNDDKRDELYNLVTWYDLNDDDIDLKKANTLIRICQEILKYKGEQVETLLHELEEMTLKQAEEEVRRQGSDLDIRSKKSSSLEYENLEQKYLELKEKYKKMHRNTEKKSTELEKITKKLRILEAENRQLQNEIKTMHHDIGSESDNSESLRDQQRELVETIHNKNKQISDLLRDAEEVENENVLLRDNLSKVRDELSIATKEITSMTEILKEKESLISNTSDKMKKMQEDYENFKQSKIKTEQEMKLKIGSLNTKLDDMSTLIKKKDKEIEMFKSRLKDISVNSSISSLPRDDPDMSNIDHLKKIVNQREEQVMNLQNQLQIATKEIEQSTAIMKKMKAEKEIDINKIQEMESNIDEMKKKMDTVHERCQKFQDEIIFAENTAMKKEEELKYILDQMRDNGQLDIANNLNQLHQLKADIRVKEKHIMSLVKVSNKLEDTCDLLEKENVTLREKLGMPETEQLDLASANLKFKKMKRELEILKNKLSQAQESNINLRTEMHKLRILERPPKKQNDAVSKQDASEEERLKDENKVLINENEALRKGLHEVLDSINKKKSSSVKNINSETLEKLLRALDVKHISGWYHPAMRLQAELHNLQGINIELRDQLRETRVDLKKFKEETDSLSKQEEPMAAEQQPAIINVPNTDIVATKEVKPVDQGGGDQGDHGRETESTSNEIIKRNSELEMKIKSIEKEKGNIQQEHEIILTQLNILKKDKSEEQLKYVEEIVKSNILSKRKIAYLQNTISTRSHNIERIEKEGQCSELEYLNKISELERCSSTLENKLKILQNICEASVAPALFKEVERNLSNLTIKYRNLLDEVQRQEDENHNQKEMMQESLKILEKDKLELSIKLVNLNSKHIADSIHSGKDNVEKLYQQLAECKVDVIKERQRANHTNNLYELVKDQLNKSEERFREYSKYNEDLMKKNLILQEQLKDVETTVCYFVDISLYEQQQVVNNNLLKEREDLKAKIAELETQMNTHKIENSFEKTWNDNKEQELFSLRHQIVDLSAISNEKLIIAQLNDDILQQKQNQEVYKQQLEKTKGIVDALKRKYDEAQLRFEDEMNNLKQKEVALNNKISHLQRLLSMQKLQYLGCIPLCSEEQFVRKLRTISKEKYEVFVSHQQIKNLENEAFIQKDELEMETNFIKLQKEALSDGFKEDYQKTLNWMQEKKSLQINELRYKRQAEFKESQLQHLMERVKLQDEQIARLDEELLTWLKNLDQNIIQKEPSPAPILVERPTSARSPPVTRNVELQTDKIDDIPKQHLATNVLEDELKNIKQELNLRDQTISNLKSKITEHEMTISLFRKQLGDKQSQITFYERHIMELQNKKEEIHTRGPGGDNADMGSNLPKYSEEISSLKASIQLLQDNLRIKDEKIIEYQTLLKNDRDKHSLAAASLQEELKNYQTLLNAEKQKSESLKSNIQKTSLNKVALDQYISQVHALEGHTAELHTKITSLEAQLQSAREESARWRSLANDRLTAMEELRQSLDDQHKNELLLYKTDSEKLKELAKDEKNNLVQLVQKQKMPFSGRVDSDILRLFKEKDDKIHELTIKLRQSKLQQTEIKRSQQSDTNLSPKSSDQEISKEQQSKEYDALKKRYEQLLNKERNASEEIRNLKSQLMRKPTSARSDKTEKSIKEQLQRKIQSLENEIVGLKRNLAEQISINEAHRVQASDNFDKWKKMKHWQQTAEKLKNKLKERDSEFERIQQTNTGYRLLIERLERDKHNLEQRIKTLKSTCSNTANIKDMEALRLDNMKLMADLEANQMKLEMQQHHSGALGAAMLQEKLESQERKIAILELTAKGTSDVRAELERLQVAVSNLQKSNLRLEAENLDLKLDLEKSKKEVPHLQQQIQHLDSYIDALKAENTNKESVEVVSDTGNAETKKKSELERTVLVLRRIVEKLQAENKRLLNGKRPFSDRVASADKLKRDYKRLKEEHEKCVEKIDQLEQELVVTKNAVRNFAIPRKTGDDRIVALSEELAQVREQLDSKSSLLEKVKVLLHRAAAKEKSLLQEIAELKNQKAVPISPILEVSEESSSDL